jgi:pseudouridine kinase
MGRALVIGGTNTDIVGMPDAPFSPRDSNPGRVRMTAGGVGRNVAENLARLGLEVAFVTAFGDDGSARARRAECEAAGIDVSRAIDTPGLPGPVYLAVLDEHGDLAAAVSDMRALDAVGPPEIEVALNGIDEPAALVLDANIESLALARARELLPDAPLFLECVSAAKAGRLGALLPGAVAVHANVLEAAVLTGADVTHSLDGAGFAARELVALGVGAAYVTAGEHGIAFASVAEEGTLVAPANRVVNATGAGDAFMAGVVAATLGGHSVRGAAAFARACAGITLGSEHTVAPGLDRAAVEAEMEAIRS